MAVLGFGLEREPRAHARTGRPSWSQVNSILEPSVVRSHSILVNAASPRAKPVSVNEGLFLRTRIARLWTAWQIEVVTVFVF
jgi:hypothetical protein